MWLIGTLQTMTQGKCFFHSKTHNSIQIPGKTIFSNHSKLHLTKILKGGSPAGSQAPFPRSFPGRTPCFEWFPLIMFCLSQQKKGTEPVLLWGAQSACLGCFICGDFQAGTDGVSLLSQGVFGQTGLLLGRDLQGPGQALILALMDCHSKHW